MWSATRLLVGASEVYHASLAVGIDAKDMLLPHGAPQICALPRRARPGFGFATSVRFVKPVASTLPSSLKKAPIVRFLPARMLGAAVSGDGAT